MAAQKEKYLFPVLRGEKRTRLRAGPSPTPAPIPAGCARPPCARGDHYVINGYKRWITNASTADFFQLVAATDRSKGKPRRP